MWLMWLMWYKFHQIHRQIFALCARPMQKPVLNAKHFVCGDAHCVAHCVLEIGVHDRHAQLKRVVGKASGGKASGGSKACRKACRKECRKPLQCAIIRLLLPAQPMHVFHAKPSLHVVPFFGHARAVHNGALTRVYGFIRHRHVNHGRGFIHDRVSLGARSAGRVRAFCNGEHPALLVGEPKHALAAFRNHRIHIG